MDIHIFLGPTLPIAEARQILDAEYHPPAAVGDVYALMASNPKAIGVVDGLFETIPSVWHKEILYALSRGVRVFGSSSMGALRASELYSFGMEGVGRIFEAFRRGQLEDDDEVAVAHTAADDGYRAVSEAMVNLRDGLARALVGGIIDLPTHDRLVAFSKSLYFPDRSWEALFQFAAAQGIAAARVEELRDFVQRARPNVKREDALALLHRISAESKSGIAPLTPTFTFEPTRFWQRLVDVVDQRARWPARLGGCNYRSVRDHLRLEAQDEPELLDEALLIDLAMTEAKRRGLSASAEELADGRSRLGALGELSIEAIDKFLEVELVLAKLRANDPRRVSEWLPLAALRRGALWSTLDRVRRHWAPFDKLSVARPLRKDLGVDAATLLSWYEAEFGAVQTSLLDHAVSLGFDNEEEFLLELLVRYAATLGSRDDDTSREAARRARS